MGKKEKTSRAKPKESKRAKKTPSETERQLEETERLADIGSWSRILRTNAITWSSGMYSVHGRDPGLPPPTFEEILSLMTPESMNRLIDIDKKTVDTGVPHEFDLEIIRPDGQIRLAVCHVTAERDESGKVVRVYGTLQDITERKRAEAQLERNLRETRVRLEVSQALAGTETEDEVLDVLIKQANLYPQAHMSIVTFETVGGERIGTLRRYDPFTSGIVTVVPLGTRFQASQFTSIKNYFINEPFTSEDISLDDRMDSPAREIIQRGGGTSFAAFPLTAGNEWMGIIIAISKTRGYFDEEKQNLYRTLAEQGAVALRAARFRETIRSSQQRLSLLLEQSPLAIIEWNLSLEVVSWNPAAEWTFEYTSEETLGRRASSLRIFDTARPPPEQFLKDLLAQKSGGHIINNHVTNDGRRIICEWFNTPIVDPDGKITGIVSRVLDITERRRTEKELEKTNDLLNAIIEAAPTAIIGLDLDGKVHTVWNKAAEKMLGWSAQEAMGRVLPSVPSEKQEEYKSLLARALSGKALDGVDVRRQRRDGTPIDYSIYSSPLHDAKSRTTGIIGALVDITQRKRAEAQLELNLRETRVRLEISQALAGKETEEEVLDVLIQKANLYPQAHVSILTFEKDGSELVLILRRSDPFASGIQTTVLPMGMRFPASQFTLINLYSSDQPFVSEDVDLDERVDPAARERIRRGGGISFTGFPLTTGNELMGIINATSKTRGYFDEEKQHLYQTLAEQGAMALRAARLREAIRASQQRLSLVVDQSPLAIIEWNLNFEVVSWNPAATRIFGYTHEEALGRHAVGFLSQQATKERLEQFLQDLFVKEVDFRIPDDLLTKDGRNIICGWFSAPLIGPDGKPVGVVSLVQDITERKRVEKEKAKLEEQLRQAQKMEAVGRLAGGVAHDFNNMLSVIIGYTNLIKIQLSADEPLLKDILEIERAATRSRDITSQLLAFSRKQAIAPKIMDLNNIVMKNQKTLKRLIGEDIDLQFYPAEDPWKIKFDPSQLEQILINLAVNARDAMPKGGTLTIETANIYLDDAYCKQNLEVSPGYFAMLGVSDDGAGMDKETLTHVFEPFFTTKEFGKGTGLGLAMVYGIIKQNNGFINIYSEPARGTAIKIYLPRSMEEEKPDQIEIAPVIPQSGTILLVEDDDTVRRMTNKMLKAIGYTVLSANNPQQALSMCETSDEPIDLVLTDVVMPLMSGKELRDKIEAIRPGIKTIFMSGYTANVIADRGILEEGVHLLQKPFTLNELAKKIREVIGKH